MRREEQTRIYQACRRCGAPPFPGEAVGQVANLPIMSMSFSLWLLLAGADRLVSNLPHDGPLRTGASLPHIAFGQIVPEKSDFLLTL